MLGYGLDASTSTNSQEELQNDYGLVAKKSLSQSWGHSFAVQWDWLLRFYFLSSNQVHRDFGIKSTIISYLAF